MSVRTSHRFAAAVGPVVAAALLLGACGSSDSSDGSVVSIDLGDSASTDYVTIPPATTTTTIVGGGTGNEQEYTVQPGDYAILVADKFGVSLEDLENVNGWASAGDEFPGPGEVILIPAGGTSTSTDAADEPDATGETGTAISDPGSNCQAGTYTIESGDVPLRVANKFDVTIEALNAANVATDGYSSFYIGLEIVVPARDDC